MLLNAQFQGKSLTFPHLRIEKVLFAHADRRIVKAQTLRAMTQLELMDAAPIRAAALFPACFDLSLLEEASSFIAGPPETVVAVEDESWAPSKIYQTVRPHVHADRRAQVRS